MNTGEARDLIISALKRITPEADFAALEPDVELREQLDIDSMDFLNFIIALHEATGVDIPEEDYESFETLDRGAAYLATATN